MGVPGGPEGSAQRVRREHGHGLHRDRRPQGGRKEEGRVRPALAQDARLLRHDVPGQAEDPARRGAGDGRGLLTRLRMGARANLSARVSAYMRLYIYWRICASAHLGGYASAPLCGSGFARQGAGAGRRLPLDIVLDLFGHPHGVRVGVDPVLPGLGVVVLGEAVRGVLDALERAVRADEVAPARLRADMPHGRLDIEPRLEHLRHRDAADVVLRVVEVEPAVPAERDGISLGHGHVVHDAAVCARGVDLVHGVAELVGRDEGAVRDVFGVLSDLVGREAHLDGAGHVDVAGHVEGVIEGADDRDLARIALLDHMGRLLVCVVQRRPAAHELRGLHELGVEVPVAGAVNLVVGDIIA